MLNELLRGRGLDAVIAPSNPPAWPIDHSAGDPQVPVTSTLAAFAGYPNISLPAGVIDGLPVGINLFGPSRVSELLPLASAIEGELPPRTRPCPPTPFTPPAP
jgi:amidase